MQDGQWVDVVDPRSGSGGPGPALTGGGHRLVGQQLIDVVLDETSRDAAIDHVGMTNELHQEAGIGSYTADLELGQCPPGPSQCAAEIH